MAVPRTEPKQGGSGSSKSQSDAAGTAALATGPGQARLAIVIAASVATVFVWWAWKQGAYFGTVFLPGAIILYGLLVVLLIGAPFRGRFAGQPRIALAAIVALAAWTLLSIAWTNFPDAAVQYAEHEMLYAAVFALGLWSSNLARDRVLLPLAVIAVTGAAIGIVITVTLASGTDVASYVHSDDATLRSPIGYRNAEAAFLLICLWPTIVLAAERGLAWHLRALMIGATTMLLEHAVLAQSRGSIPAAIVALVVFLALTPRRLRMATYLILAAVPVLPALPVLLDVFQHGHGGPGLLPLLRDASRAIALTSIGSIALAAVCIRGVELRLKLRPELVKLVSRTAAIAAISAVVVGGTVFVATRGGPIKFVDQRVSEFNQGRTPDFRRQGTRFGINIGTNRKDFWRVAIDEGRDHPLLGRGAGSFAVQYLQRRKSDDTPRDPHSVELLMLSELGIVGLLLFGTFAVSAGVSAVRSWRLSRAAAALVAGSLASGVYWLVHASYDWFWNYPGVTAPVFFLLGAAAGPGVLAGTADLARRARPWAVAAPAVALVAAVPLFFSQHHANRAYEDWQHDAGAAFDDLDRAASLDPFDPEPLLAKGVIALRLHLPRQAEAAFRDAIDRQPDGYAAHYFLAKALAPTDPAAARVEADEAVRLNPLDGQTRRLKRRLRRELGP
jgi:hypothetical protein